MAPHGRCSLRIKSLVHISPFGAKDMYFSETVFLYSGALSTFLCIMIRKVLRIWDSVTANCSLIHEVCDPLGVILMFHEDESYTASVPDVLQPSI